MVKFNFLKNSMTALPVATSLQQQQQQPGSMQPAGPFRLHVVLKQGRELAAKDSCGM